MTNNPGHACYFVVVAWL